MRRDTWVQLIAAVVLIVCLVGSGVMAVNMTGFAGRARLSYTDRAEEGQPPEVSLGIAMGAFRGIFVNYLWIRANEMKEAGKFYDATQLATAITKLQPRFPRVWVFHAWNLAYNISVTTQTPAERWAWVNAGIDLLRNQGIPANPNDMLLHKELGWIFLHKIGGFTDDANIYYKKHLAQEWTVVLGPPPARTSADRDRNAAINKLVKWLETFENAPLTIDDCVRLEPKVRTLLDRLANDVGEHPDQDMDRAMYMLTMYERFSAVARSMLRPVYEQQMGERTKKFGAIVTDPDLQAAWKVLLVHLRRRVLTEKYNMEPARMARYTQQFGPIDWRHHAAHSLYWGYRGIESGLTRWEERNKLDFDFINTDRIVAQSIQDLFRTGELYFDFLGSFQQGESFFQAVPNAHFVRSYGDVLHAMAERSWRDSDSWYKPLAAGYENFIRDAIVFFYRRGQRAEAEHWQEVLRTETMINMNDMERHRLLDETLDVFVSTEINDRLTSPSMMINQVAASLMGAYASGLLSGDQDLFLSQFDFAKRVHRKFMEAQLRNTPAGGGDQRMKQVDADFRYAAGALFGQFLSGLGLDEAEIVYNAAPNDLRLFAYTYLFEQIKPEMDKPENGITRKFSEVFPEPQGYQEFVADARKRAIEIEQRQRAPVEQK